MLSILFERKMSFKMDFRLNHRILPSCIFGVIFLPIGKSRLANIIHQIIWLIINVNNRILVIEIPKNSNLYNRKTLNIWIGGNFIVDWATTAFLLYFWYHEKQPTTFYFLFLDQRYIHFVKILWSMHFWLHENMLQVLFPYRFWKPRGLHDLCMRINTTTCTSISYVRLVLSLILRKLWRRHFTPYMLRLLKNKLKINKSMHNLFFYSAQLIAKS